MQRNPVFLLARTRIIFPMILPAIAQMTVVARLGDVTDSTADSARFRVDRNHRWPTLTVLLATRSTDCGWVWFADRLIAHAVSFVLQFCQFVFISLQTSQQPPDFLMHDLGCFPVASVDQFLQRR